MDGYAVCKALKNTAETADLPIVILTASGEPNDRIKGLEIGADDHENGPYRSLADWPGTCTVGAVW
jgi:DNA-binding response OmpR family regulator